MKSVYDIPDLNNRQFQKFAKLIHEKASITLKEYKVTLLSNRLRRRLSELKMEDYDSYYDYLISSSAKDEMSRFFEVITTNETYFWRTTQNFELLKKDVLPLLLKNFPASRIDLWSAGCSSGEEPYNLAMELIEGMKMVGSFDFRIRASDLSERMVQFARQGRYHGRKISKVPKPALRRYFRELEEKPGYYSVRADIREKIDFYVENLFEADVGLHHLIFCRNVMIYFNREDQLKLVNIFFDHLRPGGFLVIGHSESLQMFDTKFESRQMPNGVVYYHP